MLPENSVGGAMPDFPAADSSLGCNCQYPIGLVVFLIFTILTLLTCICVCCFDVTKCRIFGRKEEPFIHKASSVDPRFFDSSKFIADRKISLDPRLLEYSQLLNSSLSSSQSRSFDTTPLYSTDGSLVTTV